MLWNVSWEEFYCNGEVDSSIPGDILFCVTDTRIPEETKALKAHMLLLGAVSPFWKSSLFEFDVSRFTEFTIATRDTQITPAESNKQNADSEIATYTENSELKKLR